MLDLVIRDGTIVDGQGAFRGSLAVSGSRIAARFAKTGLTDDLPELHGQAPRAAELGK